MTNKERYQRTFSALHASENCIREVPPSPEVEFNDGGSVWLYYMDQKLEITDKFDEDGFCYVTVMEGDHPLYVTVKYKDSLCAQTNRYALPEDFAS